MNEEDRSAEPQASIETAAPSDVDSATLQAIADAQNEYGTRVRGSAKKERTADVIEHSPSETPKPAASKKRPAPKPSIANLKVSTDIKKPPPKKRKVEGAGSDRGTPVSSRHSPTPSIISNRPVKSAKGARKGSTAATPRGSSPAAGSSPQADGDSGSEDDGIYCICRKGDNHQWMIACDGGCDDWFHGKCVNIEKQDEGLIDKYICPNCTEKGQGVTTWKPMCRRDGCRHPARLRKGGESKYCTDECGVLFMKMQVGRLPGQKQQQMPASRGTRGKKDSVLESATQTVQSEDESDLGPFGGVIRARELKALALAAPNIDTFRRLGSNPLLTPPPDDEKDVDQENKPELEAKPETIEIVDEATTTRLEAIAKRKDELRQRRLLLKDREKFISLAKERATRLAGVMKMKDMCGYDSRLSWDESTFKEWRESTEGNSAFTNNSLDAPNSPQDARDTSGTVNGTDSTATAGLKPRPQPMRSMTSETVGTNDGNVDICTKKRCQRHGGWQKLVLHDVRFEEAEVGDEMRRIDAEEQEIRAKATGSAKGSNALDLAQEGTVEVVGQDDALTDKDNNAGPDVPMADGAESQPSEQPQMVAASA